LLADGSVECWGSNASGELGTEAGVPCDDAGAVCSPTPVTGIPQPAIQLAVEGNHGCVVAIDHTVYCWGDNGMGDVGNGTYTTLSSATQVRVSLNTPLSNATKVTCGDPFSCAEVGDGGDGGGLMCWGDGMHGELGPGQGSTAYAVPALTDISVPSFGFFFGCGNRHGGVVCWGKNDAYQVGPNCGGPDHCLFSAVPLP
jgi:alpha-tubulin suppressor-like RCC1 family protein